jgi:hypothetical protein
LVSVYDPRFCHTALVLPPTKLFCPYEITLQAAVYNLGPAP